MKNYKIIVVKVFIMMCITGIILTDIDFHAEKVGLKYFTTTEKVHKGDAIIVLGAYVFPNGKVSTMLKDRLDCGYNLYKKKKANKIVVSGDHGTKEYDEVNAMRRYLQAKGVPRSDIFMDHAGFDTYDTIYRAKDVFLIKKPIIVSQKYHTLRAVYIARKLGLKAFGVSADKRAYSGMWYYRTREVASRVKAFLQAEVIKPKPKFLGKTIPIWKNGDLTDDGK